jgi:hypothetical protein
MYPAMGLAVVRRVDWCRSGANDAFDRARACALGTIKVADAVYARGGIDHVDRIPFADRVRRAAGFAGAAANAFVSNLHGHGNTLLRQDKFGATD